MRGCGAGVLAGLLGPAAAIAWVGTAWPARAGSVPYAKLVAAQVMFEKIPRAERDKVRVRVAVSHAEAANHAPIHLWVEQAGQRADLPLAANGVLDMDLRQDWVDRGVVVQTDQPDRSLHADVDIGIVPPDGMPITDDYLRDAAEQSQAVIRAGARQIAGLFAVFVTPSVKGVKLTLARCCGETATVIAGHKRQDLVQDSKGQVSLTNAMLANFVGGAFSSSAPVTVIDPWVE
jgi:hypothetical protein